jgi:hypothetical protein
MAVGKTTIGKMTGGKTSLGKTTQHPIFRVKKTLTLVSPCQHCAM